MTACVDSNSRPRSLANVDNSPGVLYDHFSFSGPRDLSRIFEPETSLTHWSKESNDHRTKINKPAPYEKVKGKPKLNAVPYDSEKRRLVDALLDYNHLVSRDYGYSTPYAQIQRDKLKRMFARDAESYHRYNAMVNGMPKDSIPSASVAQVAAGVTTDVYESVNTIIRRMVFSVYDTLFTTGYISKIIFFTILIIIILTVL